MLQGKPFVLQLGQLGPSVRLCYDQPVLCRMGKMRPRADDCGGFGRSWHPDETSSSPLTGLQVITSQLSQRGGRARAVITA